MKKVSFIYLPILFFIYIATETLLKLTNSSLCESTGCKFAGKLIWFDPIYLNFMGLATASALVVLGWLSYKEKVSQKLFYMVLFSALLFETVLLTYQYYVSPEMCKFCMGIYAFLLTITILSAPKRYLIVVLPTVLSVVMALSFLNVPKPKSFMVKDGTYLIQSPSCPHCKKVKDYMHDESIAFEKIDIANLEAQNYLSFMNFFSIPVLVIKDGSNVKIVNGDRDIIEFFDNKFKAEESIELEESVSINSTSSSLGLFDAVDNSKGCGFSTLETVESNCTK